MFRYKLKDVVVECSRCHHQMTFQCNDVEDESEAIDERSMGTEYQHTWKVEFDCEKCGETISLSVDMWEYPIGCVNYQEQQIDGASFVNEPEIEELGEPGDGEDENAEVP